MWPLIKRHPRGGIIFYLYLKATSGIVIIKKWHLKEFLRQELLFNSLLFHWFLGSIIKEQTDICPWGIDDNIKKLMHCTADRDSYACYYGFSTNWTETCLTHNMWFNQLRKILVRANSGYESSVYYLLLGNVCNWHSWFRYVHITHIYWLYTGI